MISSGTGPLTGRTIVVTRSREQASSLSVGLRELGASVVEIPTIVIKPPRSYEPLDQSLAKLPSYDWLIVTSANAARVLGERMALHGAVTGDHPRVVAVGPATAHELESVGLHVNLLPEQAVAESIVSALQGEVTGKRVLLARAELARDVLPSALIAAGALVTVVDAYRTVLAEESVELVREAFDPGRQGRRINALTFTSSSTVTNLWTLLERAGCVWPTDAPVFSIGPITSQTLRRHGLEPAGEATPHNVEGLVRCVLHALRG